MQLVPCSAWFGQKQRYIYRPFSVLVIRLWPTVYWRCVKLKKILCIIWYNVLLSFNVRCPSVRLYHRHHRLKIRTIIDVYANVCCVRTKTSLYYYFLRFMSAIWFHFLLNRFKSGVKRDRNGRLIFIAHG